MTNIVQVMPIICPRQPNIAASVGRLPRLPDHRDPFDRLLVWSALRENHALVSRDGVMQAYAAHGRTAHPHLTARSARLQWLREQRC